MRGSEVVFGRARSSEERAAAAVTLLSEVLLLLPNHFRSIHPHTRAYALPHASATAISSMLPSSAAHSAERALDFPGLPV